MNLKQLFQKLSLLLRATVLACCSAVQAQVEWSEYSGNPVLEFGPPGSWDAGVVFTPSVIKEADTLKMWYAGNDVSLISGNDLSIGYAWSLDDINWTRYGGNPIMAGRSGKWDDVGVAGPVVIQDGDTLRMWYQGVTDVGTALGKTVGYAISTDGINWNRLDAPVLQGGPAGAWDDKFLIAETVTKEGDTFKMWYSGGTGAFQVNDRFSTGYATSTDGIQWTKYDDPNTTTPPFQFSDPVLPRGGPGALDERRAWTAKVLQTALGYEMWYAGEVVSGLPQDIMYANSTDGIDWTKYTGNPVLKVSSAWAIETTLGSVILDGDQYRMWFIGFQGNFPFSGRIGYATAPLTTSVEEPFTTDLPKTFVLHQNYPNPFNPETTIEYEITKPTRVVLKVINLLGQEVRTLVDVEKVPGFYEVLWDGRDQEGLRLSSGVYLYRIEAPGLTLTRKMVLLQ